LAGAHVEADIIDRNQATEGLAHIVEGDKGSTDGRGRPSGWPGRVLLPPARPLWQEGCQPGPDTFPHMLQHQDEQNAEGYNLEISAAANQARQQALEQLLKHQHDAGAKDRTPDAACTADY